MSEMKKIIGVTSCPAGIAHTYIAAESIIKLCKKKGYEVIMETNGAGGTENRLTQQDIREADVVIVAADTAVETERFRGKPVLFISTSDAIHQGAKYIQMIEENKIEIF